MSPGPVVIFDGPCTLCQRSVRFILRHERAPDLRFASLQSETGQALLREYALPAEVESLVLIADGKSYLASDAAFQLCRFLRFPWRIFYSLRHLPGWLHRPIYRWIARNRYRWFGRDDRCPLPDPDQAGRFSEL